MSASASDSGSGSGSGFASGSGHDHGSVAEEAARLVDALGQSFGQWARDALGDVSLDESIATGSAECQLCPVCRLIALLRGTRPETVEHLLDAAGSLTAALRAAVQGHEHHWTSRRCGPVEHINVD